MTTPEEAEVQLRASIAAADIHDAKLDAFLARLPKMRASDLISYLADPEALITTAINVSLDLERTQLATFAAVLAIKDEIDRRFPIPEAGVPCSRSSEFP